MSSASSRNTGSELSPRRPAPRPWWPDWRGETVVIAASGPSQSADDLELSRGRAKVIAVNRTWKLCPWADVLYSGDPRFWHDYDTSDFAGLKVVGCRSDGDKVVPDSLGETEDVKAWLPVGDTWLHQSGTQAIVYAASWGAARVLLTGFDLAGGHWHADHNLNQRVDWPKHVAGLAGLVAGLNAMGCEVLNCSRRPAVNFCPESDLGEALGRAPTCKVA